MTKAERTLYNALKTLLKFPLSKETRASSERLMEMLSKKS